jgi:pimeloyl-ACP methyl ester carboxylesterase
VLNYTRLVLAPVDWTASIERLTDWVPDPAYRTELRAVLRKAGPETIGAFYTANLGAAGATSIAPKPLAIPVLSIRGDADPVIPAVAYDSLGLRVGPELKAHVVRGGGHFIHQTHAEEVTAALAAFIAGSSRCTLPNYN